MQKPSLRKRSILISISGVSLAQLATHRGLGASVSLGVVILLYGCASGLFTAGPRPAALIGSWVDSSLTTPEDTVVWVLGKNGVDKRLRVRISNDGTGPTATQSLTTNGLWYATDGAPEATKPLLCLKRRSRDGATCREFTIDTRGGINDKMPRRRLVLRPTAWDDRTRVLLERRP